MRRVVVLAVLVGSVASLLGAAPASAWVPPPAAPAGVTVSVLDALSSLSYRTFGWLGATSMPRVERPGAEPRGDEGEVFDGPGFEAPARQIGSTSTPGPVTDPKGDPVEVPARRTGSSEVFVNGNGTETVRSYTTPRFFETAAGVWERIDNTVIVDRGRDGWLVNAAGAWRFGFGPISSDTTAGGVEIARGELLMRVTPAFVERGRTIVPETVEGAPDTVIYRNVADGVDLVYRVTPIGLKEDVVLRTRPAQSSFPFAVDGVEFESGVDGVLRTVGKSPAAVVPLVVLDRTGAELDPGVVKPSQTALRDDARAPQAPKGAASTLTIGVDPAWLARLDDAAFPVTLDPGFTDGGDTWQNFWSNGAGTFGNNALGAWEWNYAGNQYSGGANKYWRGFIRFPQYQTLGGQIITDAKVWAGERSGNASASVSLYSVDGATGTWSWGLPTGSPIGTQTINSSGTNVSYDVTSLVQGWVNTTPVPSKAFVFVGTETSGVFSRKSLESWMDVTYTTNSAPPAATANPRPVDNGITVLDAPVFSVDAVVDPNAGDTVEYRFVIDNDADFSSPAVTSAWSASPTYTAASGALDAEIRWFWRVETRDNHGATTVPSAGFVLRRSALGYNGFSGYFKGLNTLGGNYVFTETDATLASVGPRLAITRTFNTQDQTVGVFGKGWSTPYFASWTLSGANIVITHGDGHKDIYTPNGTGGWVRPVDVATTLTGSVGSGFTLTFTDDTRQEFASGTTTGRVTKLVDSFGRELLVDYTNFSASPQRILVTDVASQRSLTVKVTGTLSSFLVDAVETTNHDGTGVLTWDYGYDTTSVPGTALLTSACDPRGAATHCATYQWDTTAGVGMPRLWKVLDRKGQLDVEFGYSTAGRVTSITDVYGNTTGFAYAQSSTAPYDIQVQMTDARANVWRHDYAVAGLHVREYVPGVVDPWVYAYDPVSKMRTSATDPEGNRTDTVYTADLRAQVQTAGANDPAVSQKTFRVFDTYGNLAKECDGRSADANSDNLPDADTFCTLYSYGNSTQAPTGLVRSIQRSGLAAETFTYTGDSGADPAYGSTGTAPNGLVKTHTEPSGKVTTYQYNSSGDLTRVSDNTGPGGGGATTRYEAEASSHNYHFSNAGTTPAYSGSGFIEWGNWNGSSALFTVTAAAAGTYSLKIRGTTYLGPTARDVKVNGSTAATVTIPSTGWLAWTDVTTSVNLNAGSNTIELVYNGSTGSADAYFDFIELTPNGSTGLDTRYTYDALGRMLTQAEHSDTYPSGVVTSYAYDVANNQTEVTQPAVTNPVTSVAHQLKLARVFDKNNNITSTTATDLVGGDTARTSSTVFDTGDRPVTSTDPEGGVVEQRYDAVGNTVHVRDANLRWVRTTFNTRNLPTQVDMLGLVPDPAAASSVQTLSAVEYDKAGRKTASIDARAQRIEFSYDAANRPTQSIRKNYRDDLPAGVARDVVISKVNTYNAAGMATSISEGGIVGGTPLRTTTFVYDDQGRQTASTTGPVTQTVGYDTASRVISKTTVRTGVASGGVTTAQVRYSYDTAGRVLTSTTENGATDLVAETTYDTRGVVKTTKDPTGMVLTYQADQFGRTWSTTAPSVSAESNGAAPATVTPSKLVGYNTFGDATHSRNELNQVTSNTVDRLGRVTAITYPSYTPPTGGAAIVPTEAFEYDDVGNQTRFTDRRSQVTDYEFDLYNRPTVQRDPAVGAAPRGVWSTAYDANGNVVLSTDPTGAQQSFTYDSANRIRTQTDIVRAVTVNGTPIASANHTTTITHDDLGRVTRTVSPEGVITDATVNELGETTAVKDTTLATIATVTYDAWGNKVTAKDGENRETRTVYDQAGRATATGRYSSAGVQVTGTSATYDAAGRIKTVVDGRNHTTTANYDVLGRLTSVVSPVDAGKTITTSYGYDTAGNLTRVRDGRALNPTPFYADTFTSSNGSGWSALRWSTAASASSLVDVQSNAGRLRMAAVNNAWARATDDGTSPRNAHSTHQDAQLTATVKPSATAGGLTTRLWMRASGTWNGTNNFLQQDGYALRLNHAAGTAAIVETVAGTETVLATTSVPYTANTTYKVKFQTIGTTLRAKVWVSTAAEPVTWTVTTADATRTTGTVAASANVTTNTAIRDVTIDDVAITPATMDANLTAYDTITTYNSWGLPEKVIEAATGTQAALNQRTFTRVYDAGGLPVKDIAPDGGAGIEVTSTFDELGRVSTQAALGLTKTFGYDSASRVTGISLPTGATQAFVYDDRSLMVGADGAAGTLIATFNGDRQLTTRADDAGTAAFGYDTRGLLTTVGDASTGQTLQIGYNNAYQTTRIDYGTPGATTPYRTYGYDSIGRKQSDVVKVNTTTKYDATYTYDGNDNVLTETVKNVYGAAATDETYVYTYDWSNRLLTDSRKIGTGTAVVTAHTYDDAGNRLTAGSKSWTYDQRGRITCSPDGNYTWDPRGTLDKTVNASNVVVDYTFDGHGRLTGYTGNGATINYTYDALDRITVRSNTTSGVNTTFTYSGTSTKAASTSASTGNRSYSRDPDGNVIGVKSGATARFAATNRHTDLRFLFDTAGNVTDTRTYDPTGNVLASSGTTGIDLGYQSEYTDPTSQQVWMAARWYNPATATFQSRDSYTGQLDNPISLNRYTYAHHNPLNHTDPTGRAVGDACGLGAIIGLDGETCVVVCDQSCLQAVADQMAHEAHVANCLNQGWLIALDGTCVKPWEPGDACGQNGIRGLDPTICIERQEPGTPCGTGTIGLDGIACVATPQSAPDAGGLLHPANLSPIDSLSITAECNHNETAALIGCYVVCFSGYVPTLDGRCWKAHEECDAAYNCWEVHEFVERLPECDVSVVQSPADASSIVDIFGLRAHSCIATKVLMMLDAAQRDGVDLSISSGFRTREQQQQLWDRHNCSIQCTVPTAPPGTSMHEKGIAFDFNLPRFAGEFNAADWTRWTWLAENAHKYGLCNLGNFSNRPYINAAEARAAGNPSAELWHWSVGCR